MFRALFILPYGLTTSVHTSRTRMVVMCGLTPAHDKPFHGAVMRDHVTSYSKGNADTARMMTPFLASKLFGSIESNPTTSFCPSLNVQGHCAAASSTVWMLRGHHVWTVGAFPSAH